MGYKKDIKQFEIKLKRAEKLIFLFKLFKSKKIILSALEESAQANKFLCLALLKFNYIKGNTLLYPEKIKNKNILHKKIAKDWKIEKEINEIEEIIKINSEHKKSPTEFLRKNQVIILNEDQEIFSINLETLQNNLKNIKRVKEELKLKINK